MEFPMTKPRLQLYRENEASLLEARKRVNVVVQKICNEIERLVLRTRDLRYIYKLDSSHIYGILQPQNATVPPVKQSKILETVLEDLAILFPDSKISVDPLETYILIDWS